MKAPSGHTSPSRGRGAGTRTLGRSTAYDGSTSCPRGAGPGSACRPSRCLSRRRPASLFFLILIAMRRVRTYGMKQWLLFIPFATVFIATERSPPEQHPFRRRGALCADARERNGEVLRRLLGPPIGPPHAYSANARPRSHLGRPEMF